MEAGSAASASKGNARHRLEQRLKLAVQEPLLEFRFVRDLIPLVAEYFYEYHNPMYHEPGSFLQTIAQTGAFCNLAMQWFCDGASDDYRLGDQWLARGEWNATERVEHFRTGVFFVGPRFARNWRNLYNRAEECCSRPLNSVRDINEYVDAYQETDRKPISDTPLPWATTVEKWGHHMAFMYLFAVFLLSNKPAQ